MHKQIVKFMNNPPHKCRRAQLKFSYDLYRSALLYFQELKEEDHYFAFEDRLIAEIVFIITKLPPAQARQELLYIKDVVCSQVTTAPHAKTYLKSIRNSVRGAITVAMNFIG